MKSKGLTIASIIALTIALLIIADTGGIFNKSQHPKLVQVMDDYNDEKLSFSSYDVGDSIIVHDKITKVKYDTSQNITLVTMKSYQSHSILFNGNLKETHNSTFKLENSEITFTVTIIEHNGIEHVKDFFVPKEVEQ